MDANGVYQLILQNRYNKHVRVYTVTDTAKGSRNRYQFEVLLGMVEGEYTYYLVSYDAWREQYINRNYVPLSTRKLKVNAIAAGDVLLKIGSSLIVTRRIHESSIASGNVAIATNAGALVVNNPGYREPAETSEDKFEAGMCVEMHLLNTGILKVEGCRCEEFKEFRDSEGFKDYKALEV
jgi:hypothetical protein